MYARHLAAGLREALADTPVVLIHGARQVGKTTLAKAVGGESRTHLSLDQTAVLSAAQSDPDGFVGGLQGPVFIDEVQRVPDLFRVIKHEVDQDRSPGRFLLTGSANLMALPRLSESLAGRMEICRLWPLSQAEIESSNGNLIDVLFAEGSPSIQDADASPDLWERVLRGGYPEAVERMKPERRRRWFESYTDTILQRDIRDLANIEKLSEMPLLLKLLAARSSGILKYADLASSLNLSVSSVKRYITLLEQIFIVRVVPAWTKGRSARLAKSPKVHIGDSGLAASYLGVDRARLDADGTVRGGLLETFVVLELLKLAEVAETRVGVHHFRTDSGKEVDAVLESTDGRIVGIEVKAAKAVSSSDFAGLRKLQDVAGGAFHRGVVLHNGDQVIPFGDQMFAVPITAMWADN